MRTVEGIEAALEEEAKKAAQLAKEQSTGKSAGSDTDVLMDSRFLMSILDNLQVRPVLYTTRVLLYLYEYSCCYDGIGVSAGCNPKAKLEMQSLCIDQTTPRSHVQQ